MSHGVLFSKLLAIHQPEFTAAEDIKKIQIILPDGYTWRYDASRGGIIITSTTGIKDVTVDADNKVLYFDASGRKLEKLQKGLNIVKTSDGKTKKVIIQ